METIIAKIKLSSSQYKLLVEKSKELHMSVENLIGDIVAQYLQERAISKACPPSDFTSIVGLGESEASDISEKHDKYIGEAIVNDHLR